MADGYSALMNMNLKNRITIQFKREGELEAGVGVGVFKDFITEIGKVGFNPMFGLFKTTAKENFIYPNPLAKHLMEKHLNQLEFLGKMLGKSIYEKVLLEVPFSQFFLSKILKKKNYLNDLKFLDPDLHKNLLFLKSYKGNISDLSLTFSVNEDVFGKTMEYNLIPNGKKVEVTNENLLLYISKITNYRLNIQMKEESEAFLKGLNSMIPFEWLQMFNEKELFYIICGSEKAIDVDDLLAHCEFIGYKPTDVTIKYLKEILHEMSYTDRKAFLKFTTSSSRPPLLGFKDLTPSFAIKKVNIETHEDMDRLPTASTCVNLLKLPDYGNKAILRKKLKLAITEGVTFELS